MKYQKIKKILFILLLIPTSVLANEIILTCPQKANSGATIICDVQANIINNNIDEIKFLYKDISILFKNFIPENGWNIEQGGTEASTGIVLKRDNEVSGIIKLGTITYQLPSQQNDMTIMIYGFDATNTNAQIINFSSNTSSANIHINKTNNFLKNLLINGNNIGFNKNKLSYQYTTTNSVVEINAELDDSSATCDNLARTVNLVNGNNIIEYKVIAENGSSKIYTLNVIYIEQKQPEINIIPYTNRTNNESNTTNNSNNNKSIDNSNNDSTNNTIDDNLEIEKKSEERLTEDTPKKEQKENTKDTKQIEIEKTEINDTDKKKIIINIFLIIIGISFIILSVIIVKKNWGVLYKN